MYSKDILKNLINKIIWLDLAPESLLNISDLEKEFKVSRTPIKEALVQLRLDDWVLGDGSHFVVAPLSIARFREVTEIRTILEPNANILSMNRMLKEDVKILEKLKNDYCKFNSDTPLRQIAEADVNFHSFIYNASNNARLSKLLSKLLFQSTRFWLSTPKITKPEEYHGDVVDIISSIRDKDEKRLREATLAHIQLSANKIMSYF